MLEEEKTDQEIIDMLNFMDDYQAAWRFKQLKNENAALKRKLTILKKKHNVE